MGHWSVHIEGHGIHDNAEHEHDADEMTKKFVGELAAAGHTVHSATFTSGSAKELLNDDGSTPLRSGETGYRHRQ